MADDVDILDANAATKTVATDEVAGVHHQLVKIEHGADGAATPVSAADPLPVGDATAATKLDAVTAAIGSAVTAINAVTAALQETLTVAGLVSVSNFPARPSAVAAITREAPAEAAERPSATAATPR